MIRGVNMWEIIWTGGLPHLPGVSHLPINSLLSGNNTAILFTMSEEIAVEPHANMIGPWNFGRIIKEKHHTLVISLSTLYDTEINLRKE